MTTVSTRKLKDRLSSYVHRAEAGERIVVLRDGRPVAALVGLGGVRGEDQQMKLAALQTLGLVAGPSKEGGLRTRKPIVPERGRPASEMVIKDRR